MRVEASGLCHTDIHAAKGKWPVKPSLPFIPGHEGVGIVEEVGEGVTRVAVGDRVAVPWLHTACGTCDHCLTGWETLCLQQQNTGYSVDGSYAEYVKADASYVGIVPDGVDPFDAAPLTCAGVTTYKAVKVSGARSSDIVAVFGIGGLGHLAVQYIEVSQGLGGANAAIVTAVSPKAFEAAYGSLRRGGTIVGTGKDLAEVFELHRQGRTRLIQETAKLDEVNEEFDAVLSGKVTARRVFAM